MASSNPSNSQPARLDPRIERVLGKLRQRIRTYVWLDGLSGLLLTLGIAFWAGLGFDWLVEPSPRVRMFLLAAVGFLALVVIYRTILRRAFVRFQDKNLALLLERRFRNLGDRLLTAVDLSAREHLPFEESLLSQTTHEASDAIRSVKLGSVLNRRPLWRKILASVVLIGSVAAFAFWSNQAFAIYMRRLQLSSEQWPRRVSLEVVEFAEQDVPRIKVARDANFELNVRALLTEGHIAPDSVEIRYRDSEGRRGRDTLLRIGEAITGQDDFQAYRYEFKNLVRDVTFDIVGGDDRIRDLQLQVVDRPQVLDVELKCTYPAYTGKIPDVRSVVGPLNLPIGTRLELIANASKPLSRVELLDVSDETRQIAQFDSNQGESSFRFNLGMLEEDRVLHLSLEDTDQISSENPTRIVLTAAEDLPPEVIVRLHGVGTSITADARIPLRGNVTDSRYGIESIRFEYWPDEEPLRELAFESQPLGLTEFPIDTDFDLRQIDPESGQRMLALEPGQQLALRIVATDYYDLEESPHWGASQTFHLQIVTPGELRALLERRELTLRERFESILGKMTETRDVLARVEIDDNPSGGGEDTESEREDSAAEPAPEESNLYSQQRLRIEGARQNVLQVSQEVVGVAEGFQGIGLELVNNRVHTEQLLDRLRDEIEEPLRILGAERMPELGNRLQLVIADLENPQSAALAHREAISEMNAILDEMEAILQKMIKLESYNEILDMLRTIIADQVELNKETKEKQKQGLRDLLQ